jgi:alpha-amylase
MKGIPLLTLVTLFFFAHQPFRLRPYEQRRAAGNLTPDQLFDIYFDDDLNRTIFCRAAERCYYPATTNLLHSIRTQRDTDKPFRVAFGLSGTFLEQAQRYAPGVIELFQELAATGCVEFTGETYYHSLASLFDGDRREFSEQVTQHSNEIERLFGQRPTVFRNTECLYNNTIADLALHLGFDGIITEGVDWLMEGWRSPDYVYESSGGLPVLLRNYGLSDDLAFRFPDRSWQHWPLRAETYAGWIANTTGMNVLLAMDYEAFGEHIPAKTGIFDFLAALPDAIKRHPQLEFSTPTETIRRLPRQGKLLVNDFATISWADRERDTSAWLGNEMQQFAFEELKRMEIDIRATHDPHLLKVWRLMQASDNLYYLSEKKLSDGSVHQYFSAYGTIFEAFIRLQTALSDLLHRAADMAQPPA